MHPDAKLSGRRPGRQTSLAAMVPPKIPSPANCASLPWVHLQQIVEKICTKVRKSPIGFLCFWKRTSDGCYMKQPHYRHSNPFWPQAQIERYSWQNRPGFPNFQLHDFQTLKNNTAAPLPQSWRPRRYVAARTWRSCWQHLWCRFARFEHNLAICGNLALNSRILVDLRCLRFWCEATLFRWILLWRFISRCLENSVPLLQGNIAEKGLHIPLIYKLNSHHQTLQSVSQRGTNTVKTFRLY